MNTMEKVFTASNRNLMVAGIVYENIKTGSYHVVLRDLDAEMNADSVRSIRIFPGTMYKEACAYASKLAGMQ